MTNRATFIEAPSHVKSILMLIVFFFSSRRRHTRFKCDWSSDVCSSDLNDSTLNQTQRDEQAEVAQWLAVWLQSPSLFDDWLDLRRRSPDFRKKFSMEK